MSATKVSIGNYLGNEMKQIIISTIFICVLNISAFAQTMDSDCPSISVTGLSNDYSPGKSMEFSALITGAEKYNIQYLWSVSSGKIISGLGSKKISVISDTKDVLTATVEIKGLPEKCPLTASGSYIYEHAQIIKSDEFDSFGRSGTKGRLDSFFVELQNDKSYEGVIVFRNDKDVLRKVKFLRDYIKFRQFPAARLTIVVSEVSDQLTQFWRTPVWNDTENWKDDVIIKLEDFEKLQQIFQPAIVKPKTKK